MKIVIYPRHSRSGNVLLMALITGVVVGTMMASYMSMVSGQNQAIARSQAWNSAIPVAEAGIEEALTQLYYSGGTNFTTNGWVLATTGYTKSRSNILGGRYVVTISTNAQPIVTSTGYVPKPILGGEVSRTVQVTTKGGFLFSKGLVAKGNISLGQGNVDSFDSLGIFNFSRGGTVLLSNGDTTSLNGSISLGNNGAIYGHASVGSGGTITSSGTIGPIGTSGTAAGYTSFAATGSIPDVTLPASLTSSATVDMTVAYAFAFSGSYQSTSGGIAGAITVAPGANVTLYCNGPFTGTVNIPTNSSLTVYMAGSSISLSGNAVLNPGACQNFILYGLPSLTSITVSGNGDFSGCIYAPEASMTLNGAGSRGFVAGAAVVNNATFNGNNTSFNYDQSLGRIGPHSAYSVGTWSEL